MEETNFCSQSINTNTKTSSDTSSEESTDIPPRTSIDTNQPEAGKSLLTNHANEEVVLGEPNDNISNTISEFADEQGTAIPVQIYSSS
ncbi:hypothetical protein Bca4012_058488 [Brassica carinata]